MGKPVNKTLRIAAMSAGEEIGHVSGPIVTFRGNGDPLRSLLVNIEPVQAGSGDPSPDNVRPISGWSAVNVWRTGKNLLPNTLTTRTVNETTFTVNEDGGITVSGTPTAQARVVIKSGLVWDGKVNAEFSCGSMSAGTRVFCRKVYNGATTYPTISQQVMLEQGAEYYDIVLEANTSFDGIPFTIYPQIELGSTATAYEPYQGQTYDITFPSEAGTVYGGTLDVTSGVLTVDRAMVDLGTLDWRYYQNGGKIKYYFRTSNEITNAKLSDGGIPNCVSDRYEVATWSMTVDNASTDNCITFGWSGKSYIAVCDSAYSDAVAFKTAMSGVQLVYELATPITIPITPQEISTLQGTNNLWADTGDVDVEYIATGGEGGKLALLLRNRKELLIALRKGLSPAEVGLLNSTPLLGGFVRPGMGTDDEKEEDELL